MQHGRKRLREKQPPDPNLHLIPERTPADNTMYLQKPY